MNINIFKLHKQIIGKLKINQNIRKLQLFF